MDNNVKLKSKSGYSLVEVMTAIVIMIITAMFSARVLVTSTKMHKSSFSSDDAYAIAREKLAEFQRGGVGATPAGTEPVNRNGIDYTRSWEITQDNTDPTAPVKAIITVAWNLGTVAKSISITGYVKCILCPNITNNSAPQNLGITTTSNTTATVDINDPINTVVGFLKATDADSANGDLLFYSFTSTSPAGNKNSKFTISKDKLLTAADDLVDGADYNIYVTVKDCKGDSAIEHLVISAVNDPNAFKIANTPLTVSGSIPENSSAGVNVIDIDVLNGPADGFSISPSTYFQIDNSTGLVTVKGTPPINYETDPTIDLTVTATKGADNAVAVFTVNIADVNEAPTDISATPTTLGVLDTVSDQTEIATFTTTDPDAGDQDQDNSFSYSVTNGNTSNNDFAISGRKLINSGNSVVPGTYSVEITTNDGEFDFAKTFTVEVNAVPTDISLSNSTVNVGNATAGSTIGIFSSPAVANDPYPTHTYQLDAGADEGMFIIDADGKTLKVGATNLISKTYNIGVTVTDNGTPVGTMHKEISVVVTNNPVNNAPSNITIDTSGHTVYANDLAGTLAGVLSCTDGDGSPVYEFILTDSADGKFRLENGSNSDTLNSKIVTNIANIAADNYIVKVKVKDAGGHMSNEFSFTITVNAAVGPTIDTLDFTMRHIQNNNTSMSGSGAPYYIGQYNRAGAAAYSHETLLYVNLSSYNGKTVTSASVIFNVTNVAGSGGVAHLYNQNKGNFSTSAIYNTYALTAWDTDLGNVSATTTGWKKISTTSLKTTVHNWVNGGNNQGFVVGGNFTQYTWYSTISSAKLIIETN